MTRAPDGAAHERRIAAAIAGHLGDEEQARLALEDEDPAVRAAAITSLVRLHAVTPADAKRALSDQSALVRRVACELGAALPGVELIGLLDDEAAVAEAAAFALGEIGDKRAIEKLAAVARNHEDPLCRESAIAALGAIGDPSSKAVILAALSDSPAIRRRAVIALAAYEGEDVDRALHERLTDRDWQVRQAAEEILAISGE